MRFVKIRIWVISLGLTVPLRAAGPSSSTEEPQTAAQAIAPLAPEPAEAAMEPEPKEAPAVPFEQAAPIPLEQLASGGETFSQPADMTIDSEQMDGLMRDIREGRLKNISFADHKEIDDARLRMFIGLPSLEQLDLKGTSITSEGLKSLASMKKLKELDLSLTAVDSSAMDVVGGFTALRVLRLKQTRLDDAGVWKLKNLVHLEELDLSGTAITTKAMTGIQGMVKLKTLDLGETQVDGGFAALRSYKQLENLHLNDTPVTDESLLPIRWLPGLQFLNVSCTKTTDKTISRFSIEKGITILNACGR